MKRLFVVLLLVLSLIPVRIDALSIGGESAVLMDLDSGRVLYEKNKDSKSLIASITKIMTCILAIESNRLDEVVTVGEEVLTMYGSNIYLEFNEKMKLIDLVYGLMLRSGNDASVVIAKFVGGSEENFVKMMNEKAKSLGMSNTVFNNPHGLDEETENYSTAYDMALLSRYASSNEIYRIISGTKKHFVQNENKTYIWHNRNELLFSYKYLTGGKTGYTPRAGKTLVTTASFNDLNLTAVVLDDPNHYNSHKTLYEYAFSNYQNYIVLDKDSFSVDKGFYKDKVYILESFKYPLRESEKDKIRVLVELRKIDGYKDDDKVGVTKVFLDDEVIFETDVFVRTKKIGKGSKFLMLLKDFFTV